MFPPTRQSDTERTLGSLVRDRRIERGLTQEGLAELAGMSQEWVGKVESGAIQAPRDASLHALAVALDLDIADFYVAMNRAATKRDARRIADSAPVYDPTNEQAAEAAAIAEALSPDRRASFLDYGNFLLKQETGKPRRSRGRSEREAG